MPSLALIKNEFKMKNIILITAIFAAFAATAQTKADQVRAYLGDYRYTQDVPKGEVKFVFQKSILKRNGNGKTYRDLLPDAQFFSNENNAGRLIGILVNGQTIMPEPKGDSSPNKGDSSPTKGGSSAVKEASVGELQPIPEGIPEGQRQTFFESLPDSSEFARMKGDFLREKKMFGRELGAVQDFIMWYYKNFIAPILCLIGLCAWYVAKSAFKESAKSRDGAILWGVSIYSIGSKARHTVFFVVIVNCLVFIVSTLISTYFQDSNLWFWLIKSAIFIYILHIATIWIVPNPTVENVVTNNGGGNYPRIAG